MLSILIPIYNYDVADLVKALHDQGIAINVPFEILCVEDSSSVTFNNRDVEALSMVQYKVLEQNLGRAKIRNHLAGMAQYDQLLFLDCDSKIVRNDFLSNYMNAIPFKGVVSGGRVYGSNPPSNPDHYLHWLYGTKKESRSLAERQKHPIKYFHSNNFVITKSAFKSINFDESIVGYGYEDLVLAKELNEAGFSIKHIDNSVEHTGLETKEIFLKKTEKAISNLIAIKKSGVEIDTNLEGVYNKLKSLGLLSIYRLFFSGRQSKLRKKLIGGSPRLRDLDLYKLNFYDQLLREG